MPKLTTSKGKTFDVDYAWAPAPDGSLHIQMRTDRRLHLIAKDLDACETITYEDPQAGELIFTGYTAVRQIIGYDNGKVTVRLRQE